MLGVRPLMLQDARCPLVVQGTLGRRHVLVDRITHERVGEGRVMPVGQDLAPAQRVQHRRHPVLWELRERRDRRQPSGIAEHCDGPGHGGDVAGHPAQPQCHQRRHCPRAHGAHGVDVGHVWWDALLLERAE